MQGYQRKRDMAYRGDWGVMPGCPREQRARPHAARWPCSMPIPSPAPGSVRPLLCGGSGRQSRRFTCPPSEQEVVRTHREAGCMQAPTTAPRPPSEQEVVRTHREREARHGDGELVAHGLLERARHEVDVAFEGDGGALATQALIREDAA